MKKTLLIILLITATNVMAQPTKRRTTPTTTSVRQQAQTGSDRFSIMFPINDAIPEDVAWKRELYRELDLTQAKNSPLYYPIMPIGNQCNLFTYLFRLMLTDRVSAYEYKITGIESFDAKDKIEPKDFLNRYRISYEEKNGKIEVADADVPSELVKRYYLKEVSYLDQRTGSMHTKVLAICPIMLEQSEFGVLEQGELKSDLATPKPLFWMKYDDVAPYLAKLPVMASDLNNVTHMTADDYFNLNRYDGKIYKTTNMQGKVIAEYCKEDSAQVKESKRIEKQITDFENQLWSHKEKKDSTDNVTIIDGKSEKKISETDSAGKSEKRTTSRTRRTNNKTEKTESATTPVPRSTARRQRR